MLPCLKLTRVLALIDNQPGRVRERFHFLPAQVNIPEQTGKHSLFEEAEGQEAVPIAVDHSSSGAMIRRDIIV